MAGSALIPNRGQSGNYRFPRFQRWSLHAGYSALTTSTKVSTLTPVWLLIVAVVCLVSHVHAEPVVETEGAYYELELRSVATTRDLHRVIAAGAPRDQDGNAYFEKSGWNLNWSISWTAFDQSCRVTRVKVNLVKRYTRPKAASLPRDERMRFAYQRYRSRVIAYHDQRFAILEVAASDIESKLVNSSWPGDCKDAEQRVNHEANSIYQAHLVRLEAFDRDSHYNYRGGYYLKRYPVNHSVPSPEIHVDYQYYEFDLQKADSKNAVWQQTMNYSTVIVDGTKHLGQASWIVYWDYKLKRVNGVCSLDNIHTSIEIVYTMPKALTLPADAAVREYYRTFYNDLLEHEQMHASTGIAAAKEVEQFLESYTESGTCPTIAATVLGTVKQILARYHARDKEFDRLTDHQGLSAEYTQIFGEKPWPTDPGSFK